MLRCIVTRDEKAVHALLPLLSLSEKPALPFGKVYQKGGWILIHVHSDFGVEEKNQLFETFLPEQCYMLYFGQSIDTIHEIGDVIAPNVFLSYNTKIAEGNFDEGKRDEFAKNPRFLDTFDEQKDYYVEDFGLSIGGIIVEDTPPITDDELTRRLMLVYEADAYIDSSVFLDTPSENPGETPLLTLVGITRGKENAKYPLADPYEIAGKNLVTTMKLLGEE